MRLRDLAIVLVSAIAVLYSLSREGTWSIHNSFYEEIDTTLFDNGHFPMEWEKLPRPLVTDLDGDGSADIIIATREPSIKMLDTRSLALVGNTASEVHLLPAKKQQSLLGKLRVGKGRSPVGMAAGDIHFVSDGPRHQVVVVVTANLNVLCFDHELNLMWESSILEEFPLGHFVRDVTLMVLPTRVRSTDKGMIIVGARLAMQHTPGRNDLDDDSQGEGEGEKEQQFEEQESVAHFSYYCLEGSSGALRWKHEERDFYPAVPPEEFVHPQHNYKLEAPRRELHQGERDWRVFRDSVLHLALPHRWRRPEDTQFQIARFQKLQPHSANQKAGTKSDHEPEHNKHHAENSMLSVGVVASIGFEYMIQKPKKTDSPGMAATRPNVLVAHLSTGIEVLHMYTGRPVTHIDFVNGGIYADINHDGVIEKAFATSHGQGSLQCWAMVSAGIPPTESVFNASICNVRDGMSLWHSDELESRRFIEATDPILVVRPPHRRSKDPLAETVLVVFLVSDGHVTAYNVEGEMQFQVPTQAVWKTPETLARTNEDLGPLSYDFTDSVMLPTLELITLNKAVDEHFLLATGEDYFSVVSTKGVVLVETPLLDAPISPPVIADLNGDGLADIIYMTRKGYYGFITVRQTGSFVFAVLTGGMVLVILFFCVTHYISLPVTPRGRVLKRATD